MTKSNEDYLDKKMALSTFYGNHDPLVGYLSKRSTSHPEKEMKNRTTEK